MTRPSMPALRPFAASVAIVFSSFLAHSSVRASPPDDMEQALAHFRNREWTQAATVYQRVLSANSYVGGHWSNYGFAVHQLGRYEESLRAFKKSVELGAAPATNMYNVACANAQLGNKAEALAWLEKALDAGFVGPNDLLRTDVDLDPLRDDPCFDKIVGVNPPEGLSRDQRWRYDLDYLARRMERVHYDLYAKTSRASFQKAVQELKRSVADRKNFEIVLGIQRILAMVGDGHTRIRHTRAGRWAFHRNPVEYYAFADGLFVRRAAPEYGSVLGARVVRIGNAPVKQALEAVTPLCSVDNAMGIRLQAPRLLSTPEVLVTLGFTSDLEKTPIVVENAEGERTTVELPARPIGEIGALVAANAMAEPALPLYLKNTTDPWWFEYLPDRKLVYFQYNGVRDKPDRTLADFCGELFRFVNENSVEYLVIDMRLNGGGNNFLNRSLVHGLIKAEKINRRGHLFTIIGRRTFSAAMNGAVDIERNTEALFVGEPTGSSPNFVDETTLITLPCSGLSFSCSSLYWQSSTATDHRTWIAPDLVAELSSTDFRNNRDPAMEAVFDYMESTQ